MEAKKLLLIPTFGVLERNLNDAPSLVAAVTRSSQANDLVDLKKLITRPFFNWCVSFAYHSIPYCLSFRLMADSESFALKFGRFDE